MAVIVRLVDGLNYRAAHHVDLRDRCEMAYCTPWWREVERRTRRTEGKLKPVESMSSPGQMLPTQVSVQTETERFGSGRLSGWAEAARPSTGTSADGEKLGSADTVHRGGP